MATKRRQIRFFCSTPMRLEEALFAVIANLCFIFIPQITDKKIRDLFGDYGTVTDCSLKYNAEGTFRRFAFIGFAAEEQADRAIEALNNTFVNTSKIQVTLYITPVFLLQCNINNTVTVTTSHQKCHRPRHKLWFYKAANDCNIRAKICLWQESDTKILLFVLF